MRNIYLIVLNTLKLILRKKSSIITMVILPIIMTLVSISLYSNVSGKLNIGIVDNDKTSISKDFITNIKSGNKYNVIKLNDDNVKSNVSEGNVSEAIIIPSGFEGSVYDGKVDTIQIMSVNQSTVLLVKGYVDNYIQNLKAISLASNGNKNLFDKIYADKSEALKYVSKNIKDKAINKGITQQSIGFLIMFMILTSSNVASMILEDKQNKTYYRIFSAPCSSKIYVAANVISNFIIMLVQSVIIIAVITKIFKIDTYIPNLELLAVLLCFGLAAIGLNVMIISLSKTPSQASALTTFVITPSCMIAGCFWPVTVMPQTLQNLAKFLPQRWALDTLAKLQSGAGITEVLDKFLILLLFAAVFFVIGVYKMKSNKDIGTFV